MSHLGQASRRKSSNYAVSDAGIVNSANIEKQDIQTAICSARYQAFKPSSLIDLLIQCTFSTSE